MVEEEAMARVEGGDSLHVVSVEFKIKQIQLGYSLPKQWINKVFINNLRLYVSLEDFFTFTSYPGFDPEASANATSGMGIDMGTYPSAKKVMLGFNVEF